MEYPVIANETVVGNCTLEEDGLYWRITCRCRPRSDRVERLYCGPVKLGVLLLEENLLILKKRVSKASMPILPPESGVFSLDPMDAAVPWEGELAGVRCSGFRTGDTLLFPYDSRKPCPCEPLFCFFEIRDGFWRLRLDSKMTVV